MSTSTIRLIGAGLALAVGLTLGTPSPSGAETPPHPDHVFVERLYAKVLGRPVTPAEVRYWMQQLADGTSRTTVAVRVAGSPEGRGALVATIYRRAFDRVPGTGERTYWVGRLAAGRSVEAVWADMAVSPEVHAIGGGLFPDDDAGHAAYLHLLFLGRIVAAEGEPALPSWQYWTDRIAADPSARGVHRTAVVLGRVPDSTRFALGQAMGAACGPDGSPAPAPPGTLAATWAAARHDLVRLTAVALATRCPTADL